jgi:hypothetical protein
MFTDRKRREIEILAFVASTVAEERDRLSGLLSALSERFLGHVVRVRIVDEREFPNADLVVVTDRSVSVHQGVTSRDAERVCFVCVGAPPPGPWSVVTSEADLPRLVLAEINRGLEGRFAQETRLEDPSTREALVLGARLEILRHVQLHWGEATAEHNLPQPPVDRPYYFALESKPSRGRAFWSYATVGLSLQAQPSLPEIAAHVELVAYSPVADQRVAEVLFAAATHVANAGPEDRALQPFDTLDLSGAGLCHDFFVLGPAPEVDSFSRFPSAETLCSTLGLGHVFFLQLVPVTLEQLDAARVDPKAVLTSLDRTGARRADGWTRPSPRSRWKFWQH